MNNIQDEIKHYRNALRKYKHLLKGGKIDENIAVKIEEIELNLIKQLYSTDLCDTTLNLEDLLKSSKIHEWILEKIREVASNLGEEIDDPEQAINAFLEGKINIKGINSAFIVIQSVARCLANTMLNHNKIDDLTPYCPVCGAESKTMVLMDDGYNMVCPFCHYVWRISKNTLRCPYCGNSNPVSLGVFSDRTRRIGLVVCQECGSTWRIIMDRNIKAPRSLLPLISLGAEAYKRFVHRDMVREEETSD